MGLRGRLAGLAAVVTALTMIGGCAGPGSDSGTAAAPPAKPKDWGAPTGTIDFWDTNANPRLTAKWQELIDRFQKANPDIKVNYVGLPNSSYLQKVQNALAAGETPDVLLIGNDIASLIAQNALVPVDEAFAADLAGKVDRSMVETERGNSGDHKLYKAPLTALSDVIWYRRDWLSDAGLKEPKSYDEFFADAKKLTNPGANRFGFAFRGGPGSMPPLLAMTYGMSGVDQFFTKDGKATLDDKANVAAFKRYVSLYDTVSAPADIANDYPKIVAAFDGGSAWAMHHNLGSYQDHVAALGADKVAGVQPFPNSKGVITATSPSISGLSIFAASEKKAAAWEFVKYLSTEANSEWSETVGQVPALAGAQKDAWVQQSQPIKAVVETAANPKTRFVRLPTYLPDWGSILKTEMEPDFQAVLQKTMAPEEFLSKYASRFEDALAEYQKHGGR